MIQLYFLSILCNGITGYILLYGNEGEIDSPLPINTPTTYVVLGILSSVTGILKLLSPLPADNAETGLFIIGDLIPAAAGIAAGIVLLFGLYRKGDSAGQGQLERIGASLLALRRPLGLALLGVALLHFVFGKIPLL